MTKILVAFDCINEGFEELIASYEVMFPPKGRDFTQEEIINIIPEYDVLCSVFDIPIGKNIIDAGKKLKLIANYAVGYNNIDIEYAKTRNIAVTNTPNSVVEPTADLAFALILDCTRRISELDRVFRREREYIDRSRLVRMGVDLFGKTIGIIGFGNIGKAIAKRCKGFNMKVLYNKRNRLRIEEEKELGVSFASKDELLKLSDIVSLNMPYTIDTHHTIGEGELRLMKPSAYIINTARGAVIDEIALVKALTSNTIAGAGLDVFEINDFPQNELYDMENVVLTPHVGTQTYDARVKMIGELVNNVLGFFKEDRQISRIV